MANWASNLAVSLIFLTLGDLLGLSATFWLYGMLIRWAARREDHA